MYSMSFCSMSNLIWVSKKGETVMRIVTLTVSGNTMKNRVKNGCGHMSLGATLLLCFFSRIIV